MENFTRVGVGLYILNNKNELLLGLRKSKHGTGTWCPPGGWLEFGEEFEYAAVREAKEEVNLDIDPSDVIIVKTTNDFHKSENKHVVTINMVTKKYSGNVKLMEHEKCEKWEWFKLDNLPEKLFLPASKFIKDKELDKFITK